MAFYRDIVRTRYMAKKIRFHYVLHPYRAPYCYGHRSKKTYEYQLVLNILKTLFIWNQRKHLACKNKIQILKQTILLEPHYLLVIHILPWTVWRHFHPFSAEWTSNNAWQKGILSLLLLRSLHLKRTAKLTILWLLFHMLKI